MNNNDTTIYKAPQHFHEVTTRVSYTWFTQWMQNSARWLSTLRPRPRTWANGPPVDIYDTTSTIATIITQPKRWYSFYHPT